MKPKTYVYIDGFNLYYGALKDTQFKWLDIWKMCQLILPKNDVQRIKYFTATVKARPHDPDQPIRQETFLRALRTLPHVEIIKGSFLSTNAHMRLVNPPKSGPKTAFVIKTEEKGSDVNLATHLLNDAHKRSYDVAVVITNDSDLVEPIRIVTQELQRPVGLINPHKRNSIELSRYASFIKPIRPWVLKQSLFPPTLTDSIGSISKPSSW